VDSSSFSDLVPLDHVDINPGGDIEYESEKTLYGMRSERPPPRRDTMDEFEKISGKVVETKLRGAL